MDTPLFQPLLVIDEQYLRGRAESVAIELTDDQLAQAAKDLEQVLEKERVASQIHDLAEEVIRQAAGH